MALLELRILYSLGSYLRKTFVTVRENVIIMNKVFTEKLLQMVDFSKIVNAPTKGDIANRSEHSIQVEFVRWFRATYPDKRIFAIPNGGSRGEDEQSRARTGRIMKDEGVDPGVPDLMIPHLRMFIEMKSRHNKLSPQQRSYIEYLRSCGYIVHVCYSVDEAKLVINSVDK